MCKEGIRIGRQTSVSGVSATMGVGATITAVANPDPDRIAVTLALNGALASETDVVILESLCNNVWCPVAGVSQDSPFGQAYVEWWGQLVTGQLRLNGQSTGTPVVTVGLVRVLKELREL